MKEDFRRRIIRETQADIKARKAKRAKWVDKLLYLYRCQKERGYTSPRLAKRIHALEVNLGMKKK